MMYSEDSTQMEQQMTSWHVQPVLFQEHKCNQEHMPNEGTSKSTCAVCNESFRYSKPYYNCFDLEYILYKAWISFQAQHPSLATK